MKRLAYDLSAIIWNCLLQGKDDEGTKVMHEDKEVHVNSVAYGYERAINSMLSYMKHANVQPLDCILVVEGTNSKAPRRMIFSGYKDKGERAPLYYEHFVQLRERLVNMWRHLGATVIQQNNCEADDVMGWLAQNVRSDLTIATVDGDMAVLNGVNKHGAKITASVKHQDSFNPFGVFPMEHITLYKAMVGDSGDKISGIVDFGKAAWMDFHAEFGESGMDELARIARTGSLDELAGEATRNKMIKRIYAGKDEFLRSWKLAALHPEWVNTPQDPLIWLPGFVRPLPEHDERLQSYAAKSMLVTADNYAATVERLKAQLAVSPFYALDFETGTPPESDDWLAAREAEDKVDVIGSKIVGGSISFGPNMQFAIYMSVDHTDTKNITLEQFAAVLKLLDPAKNTVAHNAQGFELPVAYKELADMIGRDNGWRGFLPNMHCTRIGHSHVDENAMRHGLKELSMRYFEYEQESYDSVTGGLKMNEIPAARVLHYGCDDVYTSAGLWVFERLFMELEGTLDNFLLNEQKPMYLQALGYIQGFDLDMRRLQELKRKDFKLRDELRVTLDSFLIAKGWEGSLPPTFKDFADIDPALLKDIVLKSLHVKLDTAVRTISKMIPMIGALGVEGAPELQKLFEAGDGDGIKQFIGQRFTAAPTFNIGSPKQIASLLYDKEYLGLPVRLRGKATAAMKAKGIKEGNPKTDDDAIGLALKAGDAEDGEIREALKALMELKSIQTRTSLYWDAYPGMVHWKTGKVHPSLRQSWTNTRRYSASDPNVQQQEGSYGGVRSTVLPHGRNAIVASLDESAQELRQLADYCLDPAMLSCYIGTKEQLRDIHSIVGARIAGVTYDEFRVVYKLEEKEAQLPEDQKTSHLNYGSIRQKAKITIFSLVYGATAPKIAMTLGITEDEAQGYIDTIFEMFPGILVWKQATEEYARLHGNVPIHGGGIRHLASLLFSDDSYTASKALRQAGNARIQASGGNQIKRVMTRIWDSRLLDDFDYRFMFSVHDETVHSMDKDQAPEILRQLHGFMTEQYLNTVPSASSIGIGKSFGTLKELGEVWDAAKIEEAVKAMFNPEPETV